MPRVEPCQWAHLHHEHDGVEGDHGHDGVLEGRRHHELPHAVLEALLVLGHVPGERLGTDGEVNAGPLRGEAGGVRAGGAQRRALTTLPVTRRGSRVHLPPASTPGLPSAPTTALLSHQPWLPEKPPSAGTGTDTSPVITWTPLSRHGKRVL